MPRLSVLLRSTHIAFSMKRMPLTLIQWFWAIKFYMVLSGQYSCGKLPKTHFEQGTCPPSDKDCYHTSTSELLHLHFICCAIIPRPAPFSDPSCLSAPPPFCLFTSSIQQAAGKGLFGHQKVFHTPESVSFFACTKTTPTHPIPGEENFLWRKNSFRWYGQEWLLLYCRLVLQVDQVQSDT